MAVIAGATERRATGMRRVLLPVDGSRASLVAVRHTIGKSREADLELHVLHVQPPLRLHVAQFVDRAERESFYRDQSARALRAARVLLDEAGTKYVVHTAVGSRAEVITELARGLRCDHIVMGTTRKSALARAVEASVTSQVLERTTVPLVLVAADDASLAERYGIPAAVGGTLALLLAAAAD
jgi:nucleotide-binding universal stress UspA family protein